jgi:hypothetical protein
VTAIPIDLALERADFFLEESRRLQDLGDYEKASVVMEAAYRAAPMAPRVWFAASVLKMKLRDFQWAHDTLTMTHQAIPSEPLPCLNAGLCAISLGKYEEAKHWLWKATKRFPKGEGAAAWQAYASVLSMLGLDAAYQRWAYQKCMSMIGKTPEDRFNIGLVHLLHGQYKEGFDLYEARHELPGFGTHRKSDLPMWDGVAAGRVLVLSEQGLGDSIMMERYLGHIPDYVVSVQGPLVTWFSGRGHKTVAAGLEPIPEAQYFDFQIPMMSLPRVFGVIPPTFTKDGLFGAVDRRLCRNAKDTPRVGICWSGNKDHSNDLDRSMPDYYANLLASEIGMGAVSLTVGRGFSPTGKDTYRPESFQATAEVIETLDAVISVDTAVAHLAGTLGLPTILLAPSAPEWRWGISGDSTPFYPSMQIVRRRNTNAWPSAIQEAATRLKGILG